MPICAEWTTPESFLTLQSIVGSQYFQVGSSDFQTKSVPVQLHGKTWTPVKSVLALYKRQEESAAYSPRLLSNTNQLNERESKNDNYEVVFNALFTQQMMRVKK